MRTSETVSMKEKRMEFGLRLPWITNLVKPWPRIVRKESVGNTDPIRTGVWLCRAITLWGYNHPALW